MIEYELQDSLALIRLNRPEKRNALTVEMRIDLANAFERADRDAQVRAVVLCAAGSAFCAGADVDLMGGRDIAAGRERMVHLHRMVQAIYHFEKPVVAAVQGAAVGVGWSLALCCDAIVASENARFAQIFRKLALAPDGGAVYLLARQLGWRQAKDLVLSGRFIDAAQAYTLGLVNAVVPLDEVLSRACVLASQYGSASGLATRLTKRMFEMATAPSFDEFLQMERLIQPGLTQTKDHLEAKEAFQSQREPRFN